jgi:hypothetical protein
MRCENWGHIHCTERGLIHCATHHDVHVGVTLGRSRAPQPKPLSSRQRAPIGEATGAAATCNRASSHRFSVTSGCTLLAQYSPNHWQHP